MKGDPTPVCHYCREYTPDAGHFVEALEAWVCFTCLPEKRLPSDLDFRAAIASIGKAVADRRALEDPCGLTPSVR